MKVLTLEDVHIREKGPSRARPAKGVVFKDFVIEVARTVEGENIDGNAAWYQDLNGDFVWSGGTTRVEEAPRVRVGDTTVVESRISAGQRKLGIPQLWEHTRGAGVRVAVIDSGLLHSHPEFQGNFVEGFNARNPGKDFEDMDGHGTHCAGIIGARGVGDVIGVAPECQLFPIKMIHRQTSGFLVDAFVAAVAWAIEKKVHVISVSLGIDQDNDNKILESVEKALQAGIAVVAAIGNEGQDHDDQALRHGDFPAAHPECISVGALDDDLTLTAYTSRFADITVCAPGNEVNSTWKDGGYNKETCTSMATPFVAGVVALMRAKNPNATVEQIRSALVGTALVKQHHGLTYRVIQPLAAFNAV